MVNSAIYSGWVEHRRFLPVEHTFRYRLFMMYLDLDELPSLFSNSWLWSVSRRNLAWFKRADYLGNPDIPLKVAVKNLVKQKINKEITGAIRLLTHMRYFGHCFNPVSFYYCYAADGETLQAIVAEINNTPWGERHAYVLDCEANPQSSSQLFRFEKDFHVSPFMPMDIYYEWAFSSPSQQLNVYMLNKHADGRMFDATLELQHKELTANNLRLALIAFPVITIKVVTAIYWQAFRLWLKRVPFYPHPTNQYQD